ncbi:hypothetical protein HK097_002307 [Rhizophlyctis rosea]|uniref:DNA polymerase n=1 Tax=Rhizophlyctis rosea TaxID=64517 RepID=A0AAD5X084_9FUNG|nr:hypothetical protein HK097_002307 [Rhizophlyctis rosea]
MSKPNAQRTLDAWFKPKPSHTTSTIPQKRPASTLTKSAALPKPTVSTPPKTSKPTLALFASDSETDVDESMPTPSTSSKSSSKPPSPKRPRASTPPTPKITISNASASPINHNTDITDALRELEKNEHALGQIHKANIYRKAAQVISKYHKRIESGKEAQTLSGVGVKIGQKIDELLETGKLERLEKDAQDPKLATIKLFERVMGVGYSNALRFYESGARTLEDLLQYPNLTKRQHLGLKYFKDLETRIPRSEMTQWENLVRDVIRSTRNPYKFVIAGSYRREKEESGDVDVVLTHGGYVTKGRDEKGKLGVVVRALEELGVLVDDLSEGDLSYQGIGKLPGRNADGSKRRYRRIDIRLFPLGQYPYALMHYTGSDNFNREMRMRAIERGLKLSEYGLWRKEDDGTEKEVCFPKEEKDIFEALGMGFVEPRDRG